MKGVDKNMNISNEEYNEIKNKNLGCLRELIWSVMYKRQPGLKNVPQAYAGPSTVFFRHQCKNYSVTYEIEDTIHSYIDRRYAESNPLSKDEIKELITTTHKIHMYYWHNIFLTYMRKALEELLARLKLEKIRGKKSKKSSNLREYIIRDLKNCEFDEEYVEKYILTGIFPEAIEKIKRYKFPDQWELLGE